MPGSSSGCNCSALPFNTTTKYTGDDWLTLRDGLNLPSWVRDLLGDDIFAHVTSISLGNSRCRDVDVADIDGLPSLTDLRLSSSAVTDPRRSRACRT